MANSSTFQYRFETDVIGDHEAMIELQAEGALWAAQQARESFGSYMGVSRYAAQVLEAPYDYPKKSRSKNPLLLVGSLFGAKPRKAARCRCLPPSENMASPDALLPDPCTVGDGNAAGKVSKEEKIAKAIFMHPLYTTAKASDAPGASDLTGIKVGDIVWVDRESKTILGICESSDIPKKSTATDACAINLQDIFSEGGTTPTPNPNGDINVLGGLQASLDTANNINETVIEKFMRDNGHPWYEEDHQINIVGITNSKAGPPPKSTNRFDDFITVTYKVNGVTQFKIYPATTRPGETYLIGNPQSDGTLEPLNSLGVALMPTHKSAIRQDTYMMRGHGVSGYEALGTRWGSSNLIYRDNNWDTTYDEGVIKDVGNFGLNIHRSSPTGTSHKINKWSGGCQVFANIGNFNEFMTLARKHREVWGNTFTYTLISSDELPAGWDT